MKTTIVSINGVNYGSTGNIARQIGELAREKGVEYYNAYPWAAINKQIGRYDIVIGNKMDKVFNVALGRATGYAGRFSHIETKKFLNKLDELKPDIIHMHNLHDGFINLKMLFDYIKKNNIKVVWTLHDCWSFTGRCAYFTMSKCYKWKTGCGDCPQKNCYPKRYRDTTKKMIKLKEKWFGGVEDMVIVTPSAWLKSLAEQSFLSEYPIRVINNGIDTKIFIPTESDFRKKHKIENKFIVLGVASAWGKAKGLDDILTLRKELDESYAFVLVGTNEDIDKRLPENIISIHRTHNQKELAEIYSAADVYINPTKEENYPTVNMEAVACGTPVITYNTGGSGEMLDECTGIIVDTNDVESMKESIISLKTRKTERNVNPEKGKEFSFNKRFEEYLDLYYKMLGE